MKLLSKCTVCSHPLIDVINRKMAEGISDVKISDWLKAENSYISRITLGNHRRQHTSEEHINARRELARNIQKAVKVESASGDLAKLVSNYVYKMVENGDVIPTLSEGLRAQEMMDRRKEKNADRELAISMAGILGGGFIVEGTAMEVNSEQGS
jgi:hypothetical protein